MSEKIKVALARRENYLRLSRDVGDLLDAATIPIKRGDRILAKPNLLLARELACANPDVVASVCEWALAQGAQVVAGDSPAFGSAARVAARIGLTETLKPLGLRPINFDRGRNIKIRVDQIDAEINLKIAEIALESDAILSIGKVKAHSQTRLTLCVKNCFGCVVGWRKALLHATHGETTETFAACVAALYKNMPPVFGVIDGVVAMSGTGPSKGEPYPLKLLGASASPVALDEAVIKILRASVADIPVAASLAGYETRETVYSMLKPEDFDASGFVLPKNLKPASFSPARLAKSAAKRFFCGLLKN